MRLALALTSLLVATACSTRPAASPPPPAPKTGPVDNLRAFAKLYGYVRYFHPSDEAASIDWDRFAVYGAAEVKPARDVAELEATLKRLFAPLAPALAIYREGEPPPPYHPPASAGELEVIAWQHLGVGLGSLGPYQSSRPGRESIAPGAAFGTIVQSVEAASLRGRRIRLSAWVRAEAVGTGAAHLWLRVDRPDGAPGFFENMSDRPIGAREWRRYEIAGEVADDADAVVFGGMLSGAGSASFADFELAVADGDRHEPVAIENPSFGAADRPESWKAESAGYHYAVVPGREEGGRALRIERARVPAYRLFPEVPTLDEVIDAPLAASLRARFPLALPSQDGRTLPRPGSAELGPLEQALAEIDLAGLTAADERVRLGSVVIAWNVFQHFYPYFDVVGTGWDDSLTAALASALDDRTEEDFEETLSRLVAALHDGHGRVNPTRLLVERGRLPLRLGWIDGKVVVTASAAAGVARGDVVVSIDGQPATQALAKREALLSGSPQWRRWLALEQLGAGLREVPARLELERDGSRREVAVERADLVAEPPPDFERDSIAVLEGGILYVDLDRAEWGEIQARLAEIAAAPGVVFDLRGYPRGNHFILTHLLRERCDHPWMLLPQILRPDRKRLAGWQEVSWNLGPAEPRIRGKVAFVTGPMAISYAESVLAHVEGHRLGEIVGSHTAGANGNVNVLTLPGRYSIAWTGMRVVKHDGSQLHLLGVSPTVPAARTLAGVHAGKDELLERALELVRPAGRRGGGD